MILPAIALALTAAILHALWNVLLKTSGDPLLTAARAAVASTVLLTPPVALAWQLSGRPGFPPSVWGLVVLSSLGEVAYFLCLSEAYRRGELSVVYPIARGTAPLLAVPAGLLLGERLSAVSWLGIICLLAGIWTVRRPSGGGASVAPALLTGVCIAAYSAIDRIGVRLAPPWLYGWAIWTGAAILLTLWTRLRRGESDATTGGADRTAVPSWGRAVAVGVPMTAAYLMVLVALNLAPLMVVAPVRESAIVLVTGWSVWKLGERRDVWLRLTGTLGVLLGVLLVAI